MRAALASWRQQFTFLRTSSLVLICSSQIKCLHVNKSENEGSFSRFHLFISLSILELPKAQKEAEKQRLAGLFLAELRFHGALEVTLDANRTYKPNQHSMVQSLTSFLLNDQHHCTDNGQARFLQHCIHPSLKTTVRQSVSS